jgi:hypothetical protein
MPVATLQNIISLAASGNTVVMESVPEDVPGHWNLEAVRGLFNQLKTSLHFKKITDEVSEFKTGKGSIILSNNVQKGLEYAKLKRETLTDLGLKFIRRKINNDRYYYIVNHTANTIDTTINIQTGSVSVVILDPQTGDSGLAASNSKGNSSNVKIQLQSGEAVFLRTSSKKEVLPAWQYLHPAGQQVPLKNAWTVHFAGGGPFLPADKTIAALQSWTAFPDTAVQSFSGTAVYSTSFSLPNKNAKDYLLELGKVDESARVTINGKDVGILWSLPFKANIGSFLKTGENTISIEVANLMANRIRYMDQHKIEWRKYHEINFVNINYKNFDASGWKIQPSGLEGPVTITAMQ